MKLILLNKTNQNQPITCHKKENDGKDDKGKDKFKIVKDDLIIKPEKKVEIELSEISESEIERLKKFFNILNIEDYEKLKTEHKKGLEENHKKILEKDKANKEELKRKENSGKTSFPQNQEQKGSKGDN